MRHTDFTAEAVTSRETVALRLHYFSVSVIFPAEAVNNARSCTNQQADSLLRLCITGIPTWIDFFAKMAPSVGLEPTLGL